jgi:putative tryptophan/tyrosine transport system substrate-binding protein
MHAPTITRRGLITLLGTTAAWWPLDTSAQALPVIGFVNSGNSGPSATFSPLMNAFHQGLNKGGYFEGQNTIVEYRWAGGHYDRLPEFFAELVSRRVTLIVASGGLVSALAAKATTNAIPILFIAGFDPVQVGLVTSLGNPGGNATGVSVYTTELAQKRLDLLHQLVPKATFVALLLNPKSTEGAVPKIEKMRVEKMARQFGLSLLVLEASAEGDIEAAFARAAMEKVGALMVNADPYFTPRRARIVELAAQYGLPTVYPWREYVQAGGLMSYGPTFAWAYQQVGLYAARILDGAKPSELPVQFPTQFDWVINYKTVRALGLTVPRSMRAGAEAIE